LSEPFPYVVLDARYEKVRVDSIIQSQAVLIGVGIDWEGRRQVLGVTLPTGKVARAGASS
jgi:transposase-like protein